MSAPGTADGENGKVAPAEAGVEPAAKPVGVCCWAVGPDQATSTVLRDCKSCKMVIRGNFN